MCTFSRPHASQRYSICGCIFLWQSSQAGKSGRGSVSSFTLVSPSRTVTAVLEVSLQIGQWRLTCSQLLKHSSHTECPHSKMTLHSSSSAARQTRHYHGSSTCCFAFWETVATDEVVLLLALLNTCSSLSEQVSLSIIIFFGLFFLCFSAEGELGPGDGRSVILGMFGSMIKYYVSPYGATSQSHTSLIFLLRYGGEGIVAGYPVSVKPHHSVHDWGRF